MGTENRYKMSQESLDKIKEELDYLETVRTKEVAEQIKEARSFGDLSENSEYDEAKTEQGKLYSRIAELKDLVENAQIDNTIAAAGVIGHGTHVKIKDLEDNSIMEYQIVGSQDANPMQGRVSSDSPFGMALLGHKNGDKITVDAPAGPQQFKVLEVIN